MPFVMSLEGPALMPWAELQNKAYELMPKPFWRASAELRGVFSPIRMHPFAVLGGLVLGVWLAGSAKGRRLIKRRK